MEQAKKHRIFLALNLPLKVKEELAVLISNLKKINPASVIKWVNPQNLHITLHFLGYLNDEEIRKVNEIVKKEVINCGLGVGELRFKGIDGFPNINQPRVVFVAAEEVNSNGALQQIQRLIGQKLEKIGFQIDGRPWHPHITLARLKTSIPKFRLPSLNLRLNCFRVKSIDLMESKLSRDGAKYKILERFFFKT
jgi:2'-5' RNA ligase